MSVVLVAIAGLFASVFANRAVEKALAGREEHWLACEHTGVPWRSRGLSLWALLRREAPCPVCGLRPLLWAAFVELATPLLLAGLWLRFGSRPEFLLAAVYAVVFVAIFAVDLRWRVVPNKIVLPAAVLALPAGLFWPGWPSGLLGGIVGFVVLYSLFAVVPGGLGAGDVKLAAFIGLVTGWPNVLLALMLGFVSGGAYAGILVLSRRAGLRSYVPYAPSLVVGALVAMVFGQDILSWYFGRFA